MSEGLKISSGSKADKYRELLPQIQSLLDNEGDMIANMANIAAALHHTFEFWWTGFYRVVDDMLVLGPFQGPLACTRIAKGKGVCGTAWLKADTIVVDDVDKFPGHIACSSASRSEIVVPLIADGNVFAVLDIDSQYPDNFDDTDALFLRMIAKSISSSSLAS